MTAHLRSEIEGLKRRLLTQAAMVEEQLALAVKAVEERSADLARRVMEGDLEIDRSEVTIEEECFKLLALHQPVAVDLRFIVAALKVNNDLERVGDLAVNIAERAAFLCDVSPVAVPFDFEGMAAKTRAMLAKSLDALINLDVAAANEVCRADDEVDAINRDMYEQVKKAIRKHPEHIEQLVHLLCVSRHLERVADHATNIAEDLIYLVEGRIVRHAPEVFGVQRGGGQ